MFAKYAPLVIVVLWPLLVAFDAFDMSQHSVPVHDILRGGPPKDGIPAVLQPKFVPAEKASFLADSDRVVGVELNGKVRAYPIRILNWHEVVDDQIGDRPIAVTYCPLTGTGLVYDRRLAGGEVKFGVSGKLYQSNLLMYDKATQSLWSQIKAEAVTGQMTGKRLMAVPGVNTTWGRWRRQHPDTLVLSKDTGYPRNYDVDPYSGYEISQRVMFPVSPLDKRLTPKDLVLGLEGKGGALAVPLRLLAKENGPVEISVGGRKVTVHYDDPSQTVEVTRHGKRIPVFTGYWFAWAAFHPGTKIWKNAKPDPKARAQGRLEEMLGIMHGP